VTYALNPVNINGRVGPSNSFQNSNMASYICQMRIEGRYFLLAYTIINTNISRLMNQDLEKQVDEEEFML
jgi:hypothetical protein